MLAYAYNLSFAEFGTSSSKPTWATWHLNIYFTWEITWLLSVSHGNKSNLSSLELFIQSLSQAVFCDRVSLCNPRWPPKAWITSVCLENCRRETGTSAFRPASPLQYRLDS